MVFVLCPALTFFIFFVFLTLVGHGLEDFLLVFSRLDLLGKVAVAVGAEDFRFCVDVVIKAVSDWVVHSNHYSRFKPKFKNNLMIISLNYKPTPPCPH